MSLGLAKRHRGFKQNRLPPMKRILTMGQSTATWQDHHPSKKNKASIFHPKTFHILPKPLTQHHGKTDSSLQQHLSRTRCIPNKEASDTAAGLAVSLIVLMHPPSGPGQAGPRAVSGTTLPPQVQPTEPALDLCQCMLGFIGRQDAGSVTA